MEKPLTVELIHAKTKTDSLASIKNLNLWGNELTDLSILSKMPNLEVISLSVNKIRSLKFFKNCPKIVELYLRKNCVNDLKQLRHIINL